MPKCCHFEWRVLRPHKSSAIFISPRMANKSKHVGQATIRPRGETLRPHTHTGGQAPAKCRSGVDGLFQLMSRYQTVIWRLLSNQLHNKSFPRFSPVIGSEISSNLMPKLYNIAHSTNRKHHLFYFLR